MTTEEIFNELGFKKWSSEDVLLWQRSKLGIRFNLKEKPYLTKNSISIFFEPDEDIYEQEIVLTYDELQAINKQIEELGGNNGFMDKKSR